MHQLTNNESETRGGTRAESDGEAVGGRSAVRQRSLRTRFGEGAVRPSFARMQVGASRNRHAACGKLAGRRARVLTGVSRVTSHRVALPGARLDRTELDQTVVSSRVKRHRAVL